MFTNSLQWEDRHSFITRTCVYDITKKTSVYARATWRVSKLLANVGYLTWPSMECTPMTPKRKMCQITRNKSYCCCTSRRSLILWIGDRFSFCGLALRTCHRNSCTKKRSLWCRWQSYLSNYQNFESPAHRCHSNYPPFSLFRTSHDGQNFKLTRESDVKNRVHNLQTIFLKGFEDTKSSGPPLYLST